MSATLDPIFKQENVQLEPEELLEPEAEHVKGRPSPFGRLRVRLSEYGNRVLGSGRRFIEVASETLSNIGTAIAGSIVFLPLLIVVRGFSVLANGVIQIFKPMLLSLVRALLDGLRTLMWPLHELFINFNKRILFPIIKRIKEDDVAALVAFVALVAVVGGVVFLLTRAF
jgi:hypothetical protein